MTGDAREIFRWIAEDVSVHTYVNVMDQYYPAWKVGVGRKDDAINRRVHREELDEAVRAARAAGLYRLDVRFPRSPGVRWTPTSIPSRGTEAGIATA